MEFRTPIQLIKEKKQIDYNSNVVLFGSCFVENIEKYFNYFKFQNITNPHGIIFHPKSIEKSISECVKNKEYQQRDLYYNQDYWLSFNHHSKFSSDRLDEVLTKINSNIKTTHHALKKASHVFITLGTAWIYRFEASGNIVANCHKIPQKEFQKSLLSIEQITQSLTKAITNLKKINPDVTILLTVSPVRHLRDGFVENSRSKAHLHTAIHEVVDKKSVFYFPSFEIMMDDLRDYRFYKNDWLHPSETALKYIWEKFKFAWIAEKAYPLLEEIDGIQKSLEHKPFRKDSEEHQKFLLKLQNKMESISASHPFIKFS